VGGDVRFRLFAAARAAADGTSEVTVPAGSVRDAVAALAEGRSARFRQVLSISTLLSEGVRLRADSQAPLPAGAVVDVLPPFAGG